MINNFKLHENEILNMDFKDPVVIASFNDKLCDDIKKRLVADLRYGREMLQLYKSCRNDMDVYNAADMLKKMERIFTGWQFEK